MGRGSSWSYLSLLVYSIRDELCSPELSVHTRQQTDNPVLKVREIDPRILNESKQLVTSSSNWTRLPLRLMFD